MGKVVRNRMTNLIIAKTREHLELEVIGGCSFCISAK